MYGGIQTMYPTVLKFSICATDLGIDFRRVVL